MASILWNLDYKMNYTIHIDFGKDELSSEDIKQLKDNVLFLIDSMANIPKSDIKPGFWEKNSSKTLKEIFLEGNQSLKRIDNDNLYKQPITNL